MTLSEVNATIPDGIKLFGSLLTTSVEVFANIYAETNFIEASNILCYLLQLDLVAGYDTLNATYLSLMRKQMNQEFYEIRFLLGFQNPLTRSSCSPCQLTSLTQPPCPVNTLSLKYHQITASSVVPLTSFPVNMSYMTTLPLAHPV